MVVVLVTVIVMVLVVVLVVVIVLEGGKIMLEELGLSSSPTPFNVDSYCGHLPSPLPPPPPPALLITAPLLLL